MMKVPTVISLFSGAGGLDHGLEAAGLNVGVASELDADCCASLRASRPSWPVIERDIHQVPTRELLDASSVESGDRTILVGGPPCQPFSKSGWWANGDSKRLADPRASTLAAYLRVLEEAAPAAFVLENVEGLAYRSKDEGLNLLLSTIGGINDRLGTAYDPVVVRVDAADYGVPQHRVRVLVIGLRDGARFKMPAPTHGDGLGLQPHHTAWDAIGDLSPGNEDLRMRGCWANLLPSIPEGQNYLYHTDRGAGVPLFGWRRRYWSFLLKLAKDRPAWTLQAQPGPATGPFHWDNRLLSVREMCRLQTFPDDVTIIGSRTSAVRQIGNAVPSLLGEVIGRALWTQAFGREALTADPTLLPTRRMPIPSERQPTPVPAEYRDKIGVHEPHPGTGKGYSRLGRAA